MRTLIGDSPEPSRYGNKAIGLWWLTQHGYSVPNAILLATDQRVNDDDRRELAATISSHLGEPNPSNKLIVRSSSENEDQVGASGAGQYHTVGHLTSWDELWKGVDTVQTSALTGTPRRIPIIVQKELEVQMSGVLFPTDPISGSRTCSYVDVIEGFGAGLVSGSREGNSFRIWDDRVERVAGTFDPGQDWLRMLRENGQAMERSYGRPCDIEWAVDHSGILWMLQIRPVVGGQYSSPVLEEVTEATSSSRDDKVRLRLLARKLDIRISRAWLLRANTDATKSQLSDCLRSLPSTGIFSLVIIEPPLVGGHVLRHFTSAQDVLHDLTDVLAEAAPTFWKCTTIIKEIIQPRYTGIMARDRTGYWVELAHGHFVPKGIVETSYFRIDLQKSRVASYPNAQHLEYEIGPGGPVAKVDGETSLIDDHKLMAIAGQFDRLFDQLDGTVEFGIEESGDPYLIDFVPNSSGVTPEIQEDLMVSGVLSKGRVKGRLVRVDDSEHAAQSQNWHAKNASAVPATPSLEALIVAAGRPYLSLMAYLDQYPPDKIGFVFEQPGVLTHFSIQLRERGIPAIWCGRDRIRELTGQIVQLDADTPGLVRDSRLTPCLRSV